VFGGHFLFMITPEQAKQICSAKVITDLQTISVIERYIYDKKGVTVSINKPLDIIQIQLMNVALETASNYYLGQ
jgi:hypothetical protein